MVKDDNRGIWNAFISEQASPGFTEFHSDDKTHDPEGEEPGLEAEFEDEEGSTFNLDSLIAKHASDSDEEDEDEDPGDAEVIAPQGRGETAAQFNALKDTEF